MTPATCRLLSRADLVVDLKKDPQYCFKSRRCRLLLPSLITLLSSTAVAAESHFEGIAAPTEERIEDSKFDIAFGGMWSAGNTDSATLSASYEGHRRWDQNQMSSKGGVTFGSAVADTDGDGRLWEEEKATGRVETASRKEAWLRYDRHLGDRDSFYSLAGCLLYTSPSPRDATLSRMPSSA